MTAAPTDQETKTGEEGNILLLAMGYVIVIVLAVFLTATLSGLHSERQRLIALADSAALVAVDQHSRSLYLAKLSSQAPPATEQEVVTAVRDFLASAPATQGFTNLGLVAVRLGPHSAVEVELSATHHILAAFDLTGRRGLTINLRAAGAATTLE